MIYKKLCIACFCTVLLFTVGKAQTNSNFYQVTFNSAMATNNDIPFWLVANKYGAVPKVNYGGINTRLFSDFNFKTPVSFSYKASITGILAKKNEVFVNELYAGFAYKKWKLYAGAKDDAVMFEGLSLTNGNIIKSINTRAFPGVQLTSDFMSAPFAKKWLTFKVSYAEYVLNDERVVTDARLHHKSLFFKAALSTNLQLITGLDHYVQWGGTSDEYGKLPASFNDYLKIITGTAGGANAYEGEQVNALGNHVGAYTIQLQHTGKQQLWRFYYSHPFEDRSGREFTNYPDGLYGFFIDFKKPNHWLTHLVTEFYYTKHQSGTTSVSGYDAYFNNKVYGSGWTYFGNTIGAPLFLTRPEVNDITPGISEPRFTAVHLGFKGNLSENITYKSNLTYANYPGWFNTPNTHKNQFATSFECGIAQHNLPFDLSFGLAADFGNYSDASFGGFLSIIKKGIF